MREDLDLIAARVQRIAEQLRPMQVAGGTLSAAQVRQIVTVLDRAGAQTRMTGRRVDELLHLIVAYGVEAPPRPALRLVQGGAPPDGPEAA